MQLNHCIVKYMQINSDNGFTVKPEAHIHNENPNLPYLIIAQSHIAIPNVICCIVQP